MKTISRIYFFFLSKLYSIFIHTQTNISLGQKVRFKRLPLIYVDKNSKLIIGNNVMINSDNSRYHLNMFTACKLIIDKPGATLTIGDNCRIHGTCIHAYKSVTIGKNCLIAANTQIIDGNGHQLSFDNISNRINTVDEAKPVVIEDNVWIGTGVIILPGVTIGTGSVIAAGSIVSKSIPSMVIAGGNPVKVIKDMNTNSTTTL